MRYQNIKEAVFCSRPNRFIAQVEVDGEEKTVHVKNTGRCKELLVPGVKVILEHSDNTARKTEYDLVSVYKEGMGLINIDSQAPNKVVGEWLRAQKEHTEAPENTLFKGITYIKPEYTVGKSRIDFYLEQGERKVLIEVKGVTLERDGIGYFPDAPTERGIKHMEELIEATANGYDCYLAFVIQMEGICEVYPNDATHPAFGETLRRAGAWGVNILYLGCKVTEDTLAIGFVK